MGRAALSAQKYREAEKQYRKALKQAETFGEMDTRYAESLKNLRDAYRAEGKYREAAAMESRLSAITKKQIISQFGDTDSSLNKLIDLSLAVVPRTFDKHKSGEYLEMADTLSSLANVCLEQGKLGKAEQLYKRALDIDEKVVGSQSWQVALKLNDLAFFYIKQDDYQKAEPLLHRALPIMQRSLRATGALSEAADELASRRVKSRAVASTLPEPSSSPAGSAPMSGWLAQYTQVLRVMQRDVEANEVEGRMKALRARESGETAAD